MLLKPSSFFQFSSVDQPCLMLCDLIDCSTPDFPDHHKFPELTQIHVHWVGDAIQLFHPLLSPSPPAFNLSQHQVFSYGSVLHIRWPKYWSFSFSISPSNEYSGLISFRMDCLDLLTVQRTLKSLLQHHSSKASIFQCSAFFIVQLSHSYVTTGQTIALTMQTFVGKVMSLLFNMLSRLVTAFLPRSKCLLISWLQSPSAVIFSSAHFSCSVVSDSWRPQEQQHARPPCSSPTPGVHPNPRPLSLWCQQTISSAVVPFSSCPQSFPAAGSFPMNQFFLSAGQSIGASASTLVLPMNTQDWSPLGWTGWISLQSKGLSRIFSNTTVQKHQFFSVQLSL